MRVTILFLALTLVSCDRRAKLRFEEKKNVNWFPQNSASSESDTEYMLDAAQPELQASPTIQVDRKLIKNGALVFKVNDLGEAKKQIDKLIKEANGYPSTETQTNYDERLQYTLTVRVPANSFDEFINNVLKLADKVESKNITTEDVTEQFIDIEARLKTKKELETRFREILKQAKTVEEILSIETQLSNVRTEIESAEGKLNYLKSQIAMSTLTITYYEVIGTDFGFGSKFVHSLREGWDNLLLFLIGLTSIWPFVLALVGAGFWFWRRRNKRMTAKDLSSGQKKE
jgi:Domain of unknown function (DUF4349)